LLHLHLQLSHQVVDLPVQLVGITRVGLLTTPQAIKGGLQGLVLLAEGGINFLEGGSSINLGSVVAAALHSLLSQLVVERFQLPYLLLQPT
ncbi:MAG: hypothetical protein V2I33_20995, partial [Kangiellaceae bacterium]|nr:hypothetical protein [Kangiellaceae bacterium]